MNNKGITLIVLIVTIVILMILAFSIVGIVVNFGFFSKAEDTMNIMNTSKADEQNRIDTVWENEKGEELVDVQISAQLQNGESVNYLENAVIEIYLDQECSKLVKVLHSNYDGFEPIRLKAGRYYLKLASAPTGMRLIKPNNALEKTVTKNQENIWDIMYALGIELPSSRFNLFVFCAIINIKTST